MTTKVDTYGAPVFALDYATVHGQTLANRTKPGPSLQV